MKRLLLGALWTACVGTLGFQAQAADPKPMEPQPPKLRHVVLLKFKDGTTREQVKTIEDAFLALPSKIPDVVDFEWGTNNSPENLSQGFTHCFFITFRNAEGRAAYLPHPEHKKFVELLRPHLDKVLVIDYDPHAASLPRSDESLFDEKSMPAERNTSIAWRAAIEFMAKQSFAKEYDVKHPSAGPVSGKTGVYRVVFRPRDPGKKDGVVQFDMSNRACAWLGPMDAKEIWK
jgi:hypothetical protein